MEQTRKVAVTNHIDQSHVYDTDWSKPDNGPFIDCVATLHTQFRYVQCLLKYKDIRVFAQRSNKKYAVCSYVVGKCIYDVSLILYAV